MTWSKFKKIISVCCLWRLQRPKHPKHVFFLGGGGNYPRYLPLNAKIQDEILLRISPHIYAICIHSFKIIYTVLNVEPCPISKGSRATLSQNVEKKRMLADHGGSSQAEKMVLEVVNLVTDWD